MDEIFADRTIFGLEVEAADDTGRAVEGVSKPTKCNEQASELNKTKEQAGVIFVADGHPSKVLQPTVGAFDFPSAAEAAQLATVLQRWTAAILAVRADQIDAPACQALPKWVTVCGAIVDQSLGAATQSTTVEQRFDQGNFGGGRAVNLHGQRRSLRIGQDHDLGPLAALGLADQCAPFFALANVPSAKASSTSILPIPSSCPRQRSHALANRPVVVHSCNLRQQVAGEGNDFGKSFHRVPVRRIHRMPSRHGRGSTRGRPPAREGGLQGNRSAMRSHCSSVSSGLGSVLEAPLYRAADGHQRNFNFIGVTPFNRSRTQLARQVLR